MGGYQMIAPTNNGQSLPVSAAGFRESGADALEAALADMTATLSSDFVSGRIGKRHNTFEHRSRILRQMAGELATMREQDAVAAL